jgi:predicted nucleic acid-binding protein
VTRADVHLIDAGVWVAASDPPDRFHEASRSLLLDFGVAVAALDLTLYEVANVAVRWGQPGVAISLARTILTRSEHGPVAIDESLAAAAAELGAEHGLTAYDAAYVATARNHGWTLVSTDIADLVSKGLAMTPDAAVYP